MGLGEGTDRRDDGRMADLRENATGIASMLVTGLWLGAMFTGRGWWLAALLVGYIVVVPMVAILFGDESDREEWVDDWTSGERQGESERQRDRSRSGDATSGFEADSREALETLRERYAAGELTDEGFERKLERLLETETLEDAQAWARDHNHNRDPDPDPDRDGERERTDRELETE
ncbi:Short C-terminal domain-containing protein [Halobiforma haloterrestris]|uniref:Short C-terminal domain-containing protein n=1 Tax=Natronobacterium haloterrestre TaxID=148448 RepID=A0A1I1K5I1_NATHA|nr:SHOCT domain-containing protein [Halobiforma haloterrestris]SFC55885.1 Short C-terminal domain-containing protein [Halobiforma haloterrestris]